MSATSRIPLPASLRDLLIEGLQYLPRYLPVLNSDHLPMSICAMHGLGADVEEIQLFRDQYADRLQQFEFAEPMSNWRNVVATDEGYAVLLAHFQHELKTKSIDELIVEYFPEYGRNLVFHAFHPLIRLGYALEFQSRSEVAAAMAYLASVDQTAPERSAKSVVMHEALSAQTEHGPLVFKSSGFSDRIRELIETDRYPVGVDTSLADCAEVALRAYRCSRNFFALHMVTVTHAARLVSQYVDEAQIIGWLTPALQAAHLAIDSPDVSDNATLLPVSRIDGEHLYKFLWTCVSEYRHYGCATYASELHDQSQQGYFPVWVDLNIETDAST